MNVNDAIVESMVRARIGFVTSVPCKQLAGVIERVDKATGFRHVPCNKEDEGIGLCAGAWLAGTRPCIIMQNTAVGVVINALVTLTQYYRFPLPMLISYRGEVGERINCQVEMAVHTKALLSQLSVPTYHFHRPDDVGELDGILAHTFVARKPVAILTDASFWKGSA